MSIFRYDTKQTTGFALPTILIASVVMLLVLTTAITSIVSTRNAIQDEYYTQLAKEAAESAIDHAKACIYQNNVSPSWSGTSDSQKLRPGVGCSGGSPCSTASCYIISTGSLRTTYEVGTPSTDATGVIQVPVVGITQRLRSSNQDVWKEYRQTQNAIVRFRTTPQIASGAGWKDWGHNGYMLSSEGTLWGWGDNSSNQLGSSSLGSMITTPVKIGLPPGMRYVEKFTGSGQGATFICAIMVPSDSSANRAAYCRGSGMGLPAGGDWSLFQIPSPSMQYPTNISTNGYGSDGACITTNIGNLYCDGINDSGQTGTRSTSNQFIPITNMAWRFDVGNMRDVVTSDRNTCGITNDSRAYCAGDNWAGQLGQGNTSTNVWVGNSNPNKVLVPGDPNITKIRLTYHSDSIVAYFMTDSGMVYMTGSGQTGTANDGSTSNSYSTPRQITSPGFGEMISVGEEGYGGRNSLCVIASSGPTGGDTGLFCLGSNKFGQTGRGTCGGPQTSWIGAVPVQEVSGPVRIRPNLGSAAGYQMNSVMVIDWQGNAYSAGDNSYGKLGTGAALGSCNPTFRPIKLPIGVSAVAVANGDEYTAFILGSDGNLYSMGRNHQGQLGNGTTTDSNVPVRVLIPQETTIYY